MVAVAGSWLAAENLERVSSAALSRRSVTEIWRGEVWPWRRWISGAYPSGASRLAAESVDRARQPSGTGRPVRPCCRRGNTDRPGRHIHGSPALRGFAFTTPGGLAGRRSR